MFSFIFKNKVDLNEKELDFYNDLNLAPILKEISRQYKEIDFKPIYYTMLTDEENINYRLDIFKDLAKENIRVKVATFANRLYLLLQEYKKYISIEKPNYNDKAIFLDMVHNYIDIANEFINGIEKVEYEAEGIKNLYNYVKSELTNEYFTGLIADLNTLDEHIQNVKYCLFLNEGYIHVAKPEAQESTFTEDINKKLARLISNDKPMEIQIKQSSLSDNIKKNILSNLALIYEDEFNELNKFVKNYTNFIPQCLFDLPRDVFFYLTYMGFMDKIKSMGLKFCIPTVSTKNKEMEIYDTYDLALAYSFLYTKKSIVPNEFYLKNQERTIIISGPNQGGKTTFARMFGQLAYLASLGLMVPGTSAKLYAPDQIFTHFEVEESIIKASGKLNMELIRLKDIMDKATSRSILILNEIFASTSIVDGIELGKRFLDQVKQRDIICVFVTFLDDLSRYNETIVSMISTVIPEAPEVRTLKLLRKEADGLAYADAIAKKYSLDYFDVKRRLSK